MAGFKFSFAILLLLALLVIFPSPVSAFGAGNIASISKIEGINWRHGDIEDMLKTVACLRGHKWTTMMIKRVYFGNWLRDYSQAVDVGTLKGVQSGTIRILLWVLSFMSFGYATEEFEVTEERLGCYRPEEHIDNPKDYADNKDARQFDPRLRPPVQQFEIAVDPNTGMKNYIANDSGGWATSFGYVKNSFSRSIHFGRMYTSGVNKGREEDLCEALRCLGQALHTLEDFGAHSNYVELSLREQGFNNVFPHVGSSTQMNVRGKHIFPLVTGTFGGVDFLHSVLGEATDHVTQSEVDEVNNTLLEAAVQNKKSNSLNSLGGLTDVLGKIPGTGGLIHEARELQAASDSQAAANYASAGQGGDPYGGSRASASSQAPTFQGPPGSAGGPPGPGIPGMNPNLDPQAVVAKIYPILVFRDRVVRTINAIISKIPGLEHLIEIITERVTLFVLGLLAPFVQPIIAAATTSLKTGSSAVIESSGRHQYEVWTDSYSTDPTHSMLSKDHFSNVLNEPAGKVATAILQYVAPRVIFAWDHPDVPIHEIMDDIGRVFHHPALRDHNCEIHRNMFAVVERWVQSLQDRGSSLNQTLGSESVKAGKNHSGEGGHGHGPAAQSSGGGFTGQNILGLGSHSKVSGSPFDMFNRKREMGFADEPLPESSMSYQGQEAYGQQQHSQPQGYGQQSYQSNDQYAYEMPTSYQQGYEDDSYQPQQPQQHQQHHQQQHQQQQGPYGQTGQNQGPPGPYGQY